MLILVALCGCSLFDDPPVAVIAVPQETVPLQLDKGEPAPVDGWLFSDGLFNELSPAIRDHYEQGTGSEEQESPEGADSPAAPETFGWETRSGHSLPPLAPTTRDVRAQGE